MRPPRTIRRASLEPDCRFRGEVSDQKGLLDQEKRWGPVPERKGETAGSLDRAGCSALGCEQEAEPQNRYKNR